MSTAIKWNSKLMFPTMSDAINRVLGIDFGPSNSSGNPMVTLNLELAAPKEVEIDGKQVTIAGVKTRFYFTTTVFKKDDHGERVIDEIKTENARGRFKEFLAKIEYPDIDSINWDNFNHTPIRGKLLFCLMEANVVEKRANPTADELKKDRKAEGKVLRHPVTKVPLVDYWPTTTEIFDVAPADGVNVPY